MGFTWDETRRFLASVRGLLSVVPLTIADREAALDIAESHDFSIYDALIVASALSSGCDTLWTEDLQDGQLIDGRLRVRDPFVLS